MTDTPTPAPLVPSHRAEPAIHGYGLRQPMGGFAEISLDNKRYSASQVIEALTCPERSNPGADVERLRAALEALETACDNLCATRSKATYLRMIDEDGASEALVRLDDARREARAVLATPTRAENAQGSGEDISEIVAPWADFHGELPDYDHPLRCVFESGVQYAIELLAKELGVTDWQICEGTEEFDGDLGGTLMNIVRAAMPEDAYGEHMWPSEVRAALIATPQASNPDQPAENAKCSGMEEVVRKLLWQVEQVCGPLSTRTTVVAGDDDRSILEHNFRAILAALSAQSGGQR